MFRVKVDKSEFLNFKNVSRRWNEKAQIVFTSLQPNIQWRSQDMTDNQNPPKRTEKIQLLLDDDELQAIDDWRFENRLPSRAATIRELIRRGLITNEQFEAPPRDAPSGEFRVIDDSEK